MVWMATTSLSEVEAETRRIAGLASAEGRCPHTGKRSFAAALAAILRAEDMCDASVITVDRRGPAAEALIFFRKEGDAAEDAVWRRLGASKFGTIKTNTHYDIMSRTTLFLSAVIPESMYICNKGAKK